MPAIRGIIPTENAVILCSVAVTHLGIIARAPDVLHNPEVFLPDDVWAVYTDPASLPEWRNSVLEIVGLEGETGSRQWTEVSEHNVRTAFQETVFDAPRRYELNTSSDGYFTGHYVAVFEQVELGVVRGTFTETITTEGLKAKILALLFVRPKQLIEEFA